MKVVVVESPSKAKTINKYLGPGFEVLASFGHIRDLPAKDGSVDPDDNFKMLWEVDPQSQKRVNDIAHALKKADTLILATDPDREGEAISWHVLEALNEKHALKDQKVERVVFNAITKQSVTEAMKHPRAIDGALVDAYLARRALDYLVGFTLSPVLWRKLPGARSAGRVQSVALRLVCDRELEIEKFIKKEYWSIVAKLATPRGDAFEARLVAADGQKFQRLDIGSGKQAEDLKTALEGASFTVAAVEAKPARRNPPPPFTTSTMQQEASRKLGFAPAIAMRLAQRLYEGVELDGETTGLITYMRTDGIDMAPEAIADIRAMIGKNYGKEYVPGSPRTYQNKSKNAQEAHEAVRPTDPHRTPDQVAKYVDRDQARLYELIWNRAVASQMESAELERTTVDIVAKNQTPNGARSIELRASGQVVKFDGFLTLYQEGQDETPEDEESKRLPAMAENEALAKQGIEASQHFTEPPPRFSEAALVKRMEELDIGRPSTYASILQVLQDRGYVRIDKKRLIPEDKGRVVVGFLESFFARYVEYDFTASLEEQLDRVSNNEMNWKEVLREFWTGFIGAVNDIKELRITQVLDALNDLLEPHIFPARADGGPVRQCPTCATGQLSLKVGRFGAFIGCSNYPECTHTRQMTPGAGGMQSTKVLGTDPVSNLEVTLRGGRFGTYLQLGEEIKAPKRKKGEKKDPDAPKSEKILPVKPKRASLPKGVAPEDIDLEKALALLSLPREVGKSPEDGEPILAGVGRFGPYVKHGKVYASLEDGDDVLTVGLNRAVTLIAEKIANPKKGRRFGADPGKTLGEHPDKGGAIVVKNGRYGPYVSHNGVNATLTGDKTPETVTLDEAIVLLDARAAMMGNSPKGRRAAGRKQGSAKKAAANPDARAKKPAAAKPKKPAVAAKAPRRPKATAAE
ncbi:MAG: type I DNA topoisomerase [Rhizobiales bacterium]|nr:type I DNA topoisomerase [Hyphomicrobiales bacterium]